MNVQSELLTFEQLNDNKNRTYNIGNLYTESSYLITGIPSYVFEGSGFYVIESGDPLYTGSLGLRYTGVGAHLELKRSDNSSFDIVSIDISRGDSNSPLIPIGFTGIKLDGSEVYQTYWFQDSIIGKNETFQFDTSFSGLRSVQWQQGAVWHQFDNISLAATIAEPATYVLMLAGLGLLTLARRRRQTNLSLR